MADVFIENTKHLSIYNEAGSAQATEIVGLLTEIRNCLSEISATLERMDFTLAIEAFQRPTVPTLQPVEPRVLDTEMGGETFRTSLHGLSNPSPLDTDAPCNHAVQACCPDCCVCGAPALAECDCGAADVVEVDGEPSVLVDVPQANSALEALERMLQDQDPGDECGCGARR